MNLNDVHARVADDYNKTERRIDELVRLLKYGGLSDGVQRMYESELEKEKETLDYYETLGDLVTDRIDQSYRKYYFHD